MKVSLVLPLLASLCSAVEITVSGANGNATSPYQVFTLQYIL